jgi:hypothetical protein
MNDAIAAAGSVETERDAMAAENVLLKRWGMQCCSHAGSQSCGRLGEALAVSRTQRTTRQMRMTQMLQMRMTTRRIRMTARRTKPLRGIRKAHYGGSLQPRSSLESRRI